jgi:hypothetical protein
MSNAAAAVANALATAFEDVIDDEHRVPVGLPDEEEAEGYAIDTQPADSDLAFDILLEDGRRVRVTCVEVER